jgi:ABC-type antimicrobial peptide transport system permease subunit
MFAPWRDAGSLPAGTFAADGFTPVDGEERPRARFRVVGTGFFAVLGVPIIAGRDFADEDRVGHEQVAIVSQSVAQRLFPNGDALNRHVWWPDSLSASFGLDKPRRIVGVVADMDDERVVPQPAMAIYLAVGQMGVAGRLFVRASGDPYALVPAVTRVIRQISPEQPIERAATLADVRAEVLSPNRVNAFVFSGFAGIALLIAVVGVAGVLAFSVSARTREFGIRLAIGSAPRHLLARVLSEGVRIAAAGVLAGALGGAVLAQVAARVFHQTQLPGALTVVGAASVLIAAAVVAALMPAARAARVDVLQALRSE